MSRDVGFPALQILLVSTLIAATAPLAIAAGPASQPPGNAAAAKAHVAQNYGKIPLSFEANQGQAVRSVKFVSRGNGYSLFLTDSSAVLALTKPDVSSEKPRRTAGKGLKPATAHPARKTDVARMDLAGAHRATRIAGEAESTNFPATTGAYQTKSAGRYSDAFIAKLAIGETVSGQQAIPDAVGDTRSAATPALTGATGTASTNTSIAQSGSQGNYTLTATVVGSGSVTTAPTGTVSFLDTSNGNAVVATATLGAGTAGALTWTNTQTPVTEPAPQSIVVGDFNGDGIPDIAAGSNGYVSVLIGKGDGTFIAASNLVALSNNQLMAAAAFVTGRPTGILTVSNSASSTNNAQLILANGSGGETIETPFSLTCGSASAVATADFNGDGKQDFLVACQTFGNPVLVIFLGNGDGTFGVPTSIPIGSTILAIGTGNFFGNGRVDIAVVTSVTGTSTLQDVSTFENDGHGDFTQGPSVTSTGTSPTSMVVADFIGNGKSDLALLNSGGNNVTIMLGVGNGTFTQAASPGTGNAPSGIAVGDFNGDGVPDLAVANSGGNTVTILQGKGDGTFTAAATPPTGIDPSALAVGDFITGGKLGVAVANNGAFGGSVTVLNQLSTQTATATATGVSPAGSGAHLVEASYPGDTNYAASVSSTTSLSGQTQQVAVPNVVGDTQAAATTAITGVGLVVGTVSTASSATVASGNVISENPSAGTSVNSGSAVNLVISTGLAQIAVPNVVGDTQAAATSAIIAAGLAVGTVSTASSATVASGNVISENPSAGTSVNAGSAVNLVVSTGPAQTPSYTLSANPSSLTIPSGMSASTVITLTPTGGFTGTVNFTCGTLPSKVTCTFMPASLTVTSSTALTTTLTIGTTGTAMASLGDRPAGAVLPTLLAALILLPLGFMRRVLRTRKAGSQWLGLVLLAGTCLAAAGLLATAGCGGSSSSTPAGSYNISITVTSGATTVPLNLSITVQ